MNQTQDTQHAAGDASDELQMFEQVMNCGPALPPDRLEEVADMVRDQGLTGRPWRLAALLASKDGAFFKDLAHDPEKAQALAPSVAVLYEFADRLRGVAELAECAAGRVMVAGCNHPQFNTWAEREA